MNISVSVDTSGPLFRGRYAEVRTAIACRDIREALGQRGLSEWHRNLDTSLRNPTPYYETQLTAEAIGDAVLVHDRGIVYGPWLEGTGSRNRTTRFKGYGALRRAAQQLQRDAQPVADGVVRRLTRELNA